ncbi:MAG: hypothetical protein ACOYOF_19675, partial [Verrucomicrobiaceae bacterium]
MPEVSHFGRGAWGQGAEMGCARCPTRLSSECLGCSLFALSKLAPSSIIHASPSEIFKPVIITTMSKTLPKLH